MRWSLSRVTNALLPSGANTTWLGPEFGLPTVTLPAGVTVVPLMVNTDTVPSARLATSASVPALLKETPAAPLPACSVARTLGAGAAALGSSADGRAQAADEARLQRRQVDDGQPCRRGSAWSGRPDRSAWSWRPARCPPSAKLRRSSADRRRCWAHRSRPAPWAARRCRSMKVTVSAGGLFCTSTLPLTSLTLASLAEIAISCVSRRGGARHQQGCQDGRPAYDPSCRPPRSKLSARCNAQVSCPRQKRGRMKLITALAPKTSSAHQAAAPAVICCGEPHSRR